MVELKDPVDIQRQLHDDEDFTGLILLNHYYYVSPENGSYTFNKQTKFENEEIIKKLDKQIEQILKKPYQQHYSRQQLLKEYELMRGLQQEKLIRYCISNDNMQLINSSVIPVQSKFSKFNKHFSCQDLQFKFIIYYYKENYDSLLNLIDRKFNLFNNLISKFNKSGSIVEYLSQPSTSDEEENENRDETFDNQAESFHHDELIYETRLSLINKEIICFWNCSFLRLILYFKMNNFEKMVNEFLQLIDAKPINAIDSLRLFKAHFKENGVCTVDEMTSMVTLAMLVVKPIRDLPAVIANENFIRFLENSKDDSLLNLLKYTINCQFTYCNDLTDIVLKNCDFQAAKNKARISVLLREKQYLSILSSMSRLRLSTFSELVGVREEMVEFEVLKLIQFLNLRVTYEDKIFQFNDQFQKLEIIKNVKDLNELYNNIGKNFSNIKKFNEVYG